jgi:hypothetical protein
LVRDPRMMQRHQIQENVMTRARLLVLIGLLAVSSAARMFAADISGEWKASFDTQIGQQNYTYTFAVKESTVTGKAKSENGESDILEGKVEGDKITFLEVLNFQGMELRIQYTGTIVSADEIRFTRQVADFATEELVAKRVK